MDWSNYTCRSVLPDGIDRTSLQQQVTQRYQADFSPCVLLQSQEAESNTYHSFQNKCNDLSLFITKNSWTFCTACNLLSRQPMLNNFCKMSHSEPKNCPCKGERYFVPNYLDFQFDLSKCMQDALRIFRIDLSPSIIPSHGYRQRNGLLKVVMVTPLPEERVS